MNAQEINETTMLRALSRVGQVHVAKAAGISEASVSRWKDGELARMAAALTAMGLKVVPADARCFKPEYVDALMKLSKAHLDSMQSSDQLIWD